MAITAPDARYLCVRALGLLGVVAAGETPAAADAQEALDTLNDLLRSLFGQGIGGQLETVPVSADYQARGNENLIVDTSGGRVTITLPVAPPDGMRLRVVDGAASFGANLCTIVPTLSTIEGATSINLSTAGTKLEWLFLADDNNWWQRANLDFDSDWPLPNALVEGFAAAVALRLAPFFGLEAPATVQAMADNGMRTLRARFSQVQAAPLDVDIALQKRYWSSWR